MNDDALEVVLIAAVAEDGTIGDDGDIPWHYPADLRHFKNTTLGSPVIMGRRTYESIVDRLGHALPGRVNVVLTRRDPDAVVDPAHRPDDETAIAVAGDLASAFARAGTVADVAYVIGGARVYDQTIDRADRMILTEIPGRFSGDTRFPVIDDTWVEIERRETDDLAFVTYRRR